MKRKGKVGEAERKVGEATKEWLAKGAPDSGLEHARYVIAKDTREAAKDTREAIIMGNLNRGQVLVISIF